MPSSVTAALPARWSWQGINNMRAVYGIRRVQFYENDHTIRVEFDASRLAEAEVATLLRYAGVELKEKVELVR